MVTSVWRNFIMKFIGFCVVVLIYAGTLDAADNVTLETSTVIPKNVTVAPIVASATAAVGNQVVSTTTRRPILQGLKLPCSCNAGQCGCCTGYVLDRFNQKGCLNITYDPDDFALTAAMTMNGKVLYKNSVSGKNPPPICVRVPRLQFIRFCVEFSNIYFAGKNIHLCVDAEANWDDFTLLEWSFDCLRMGISGVSVVRPEEGGGLPTNSIDQEEQTDEDYDDSARNIPLNKTTLIPKPPINKVIFDNSLRAFGSKKPLKKNVSVKKLSNGDYFISYIKQK